MAGAPGAAAMTAAPELAADNATSGSALHGLPTALFREKCPMVWNSSAGCDLAALGQYVAGDEAAVLAEVRRLAERIHNSHVDDAFLERISMNRSVSDGAYYALIVLYAHLICFGAIGNGLVVTAVLRKAAMKTARNMFILNLAVSDLILCLITMPLTLMEILSRYWPLGGDTAFLCKLFGGLEGVSVFVSSLSITAIALDRYQVIVYPTRKSLQLAEVCIILAGVWTLAVLLASPLFVVRRLEHHPLNQSLPGLPDAIDYCIEDWSLERGRAYYSLFSILCQYVVPIITVSIAYAGITRKLRFRMSSMASRTASVRDGREQRTRRTNTLLIAISLIYAVSWIPLNVCNLVYDLLAVRDSSAVESIRVVYAVCHMVGMSSACSNPILYGWLNDNFRKEFVELLQRVCPCTWRRGGGTETTAAERSQGLLLVASQATGRSQGGYDTQETQITRDSRGDIPLHHL
ncbi:Neuropeptide F receptor [Amphibalanus amphitrite]|uniref:Neuropeptide F receptor n=1 Tax=Amphibalanus amphitrite TaxID=1232801 RepID=A0A6A4WSG6_AMPAM|nr:Neuropeptide F receptor [Amphibalanus amphitrite]